VPKFERRHALKAEVECVILFWSTIELVMRALALALSVLVTSAWASATSLHRRCSVL
jgi:hypothetical protein